MLDLDLGGLVDGIGTPSWPLKQFVRINQVCKFMAYCNTDS